MSLRVALSALAIGLLAAMAQGADNIRPYGGERFALTLDGVNCGSVKSIGGGGVSADVVTEKPGAGLFAAKHLAGPSYEPIEIQIGFENDKAIYNLITGTWKASHPHT